MSFLYCTSDRIGQANHGGGNVTANELLALQSLGPCEAWGQSQFVAAKVQGAFLPTEEAQDPWYDDAIAVGWCKDKRGGRNFDLAHVYAGTFSRTVAELNRQGCITTYTAAAHDKDLSRQEHERLGLPYPYPHLTEPELWQRYLRGYLDADVLIVPSTLSKRVMEFYGAKNRIEVIPHGCQIPDKSKVKPLPKQFVLGYMGACGADKGVAYLLEAWKKLNYKDAVLKLAGGNSHSPWMQYLIGRFGGGNIQCLGWVDDASDFYNSLSCYCQPSVSEGYGIEVIEAMAHGRPVICSDGAGACDAVTPAHRFKAGDVDELCKRIEFQRNNQLGDDRSILQGNRDYIIANHAWPVIREKYAKVWRELLGEKN